MICRVPRETIHTLRICSDVVGRELQLERRSVVEKFAPLLTAKLSQVAPGAMPKLLPRDVDD